MVRRVIGLYCVSGVKNPRNYRVGSRLMRCSMRSIAILCSAILVLFGLVKTVQPHSSFTQTGHLDGYGHTDDKGTDHAECFT